MKHYRNRQTISYCEVKSSKEVICLKELIDRQGKRELLEKLLDEMEYGVPYCVLIERTVSSRGYEEIVTFDLKFAKMEGEHGTKEETQKHPGGAGNP